MNRRYRKTIVAGNWKMHKLPGECKEFILQLKERAAAAKWCDIVLCVPFTHLTAAVKAARGTRIAIGAQNCHFAEKGAYTGEISCGMLADLGVKYVIIGHSERRQYFGETDETVNKKVLKVLENGLKPIICVGESLEQKQTGITNEVVCLQTKAALHGVSTADITDCVIAYEPVWAIGTGMTATAADANRTIAAIRGAVKELFGYAAENVRILYGGSMNDKNANELMSQPEIDGGLIGGASLMAEKFEKVVNFNDR